MLNTFINIGLHDHGGRPFGMIGLPNMSDDVSAFITVCAACLPRFVLHAAAVAMLWFIVSGDDVAGGGCATRGECDRPTIGDVIDDGCDPWFIGPLGDGHDRLLWLRYSLLRWGQR